MRHFIIYFPCLSQHYLPLEWHTHLITPILKSGERQKVTNYRPISLLCIVSKVLESLVFNCFVKDSITPAQFGFLKGHFSLQQLLIFWNTVTNTSQTDAIYLDFRKAFDSVSHNELLYKLWHFGITGSLWMWFKAYITNRHQFVIQLQESYLSSLESPRVVFWDHFYSSSTLMIFQTGS